MQSTVLGWPRWVKRLVVVALDILLALVATWIAFTLRLDTLNWPSGAQWWVYALAPVLVVPIFIRLGLYRAIFRYTGQAALFTTAKAVAIYAGLLLAILLWQKWQGVPRTLGVLQPLVFFLLVGASRAFARFWLAGVGSARHKAGGRMLIYGAGTAGVQTASAMGFADQFVLLGFIDDDPGKVGRSVNGVPVVAPASVPELVASREVSDILLALPSASRSRRNDILKSLQSLPVHIRTLPGWADLATGRVTHRVARNTFNRPGRAGHRGGWQHRRRAKPSDFAAAAPATAAAGPQRVRPVQHPPGAAGDLCCAAPAG
jgi:FlaA1/EpsC-like NDP-sugar epimerase